MEYFSEKNERPIEYIPQLFSEYLFSLIVALNYTSAGTFCQSMSFNHFD